jgi:hypothetical protein
VNPSLAEGKCFVTDDTFAMFVYPFSVLYYTAFLESPTPRFSTLGEGAFNL